MATAPDRVRWLLSVATSTVPLTLTAPRVRALASSSDTVVALGIVTVPKSLLVPVSVKLPPPESVRLRPAALNTPPEIVLAVATLSVLSAVSVTVRLPRSMLSDASSVPPPSERLPLPRLPRAATETVPALRVVVPS